MADLVPCQELELLGPGEWLARGTDPQFRMACRMPPGWYRIRIAMSCDFRARLELFADTGDGLDAGECIERINLCGAIKRDFFVNISRPVLGFRFDPVDQPGQFRLEGFGIERVSRVSLLSTALWSVVRTVRFDKATFSGLVRSLLLLCRGQISQLKRSLLENLAGPSSLAPPPYNPAHAYAQWRKWHQLTTADYARMQVAIAAMNKPPRISVLLPTGSASESELRRSIDSVFEQIYPHWELCAAAGDWNTLLERAAGDFVCLLDAGDCLAKHALFAMAQRAGEAPSADMIYSDEDFQGDDAPQPFFKPDWSPEYQLSFPYTGRLALFRTSQVRALGGFCTELGPAQEHDLVLRLAANSKQVEHVADVLYHTSREQSWRQDSDPAEWEIPRPGRIGVLPPRGVWCKAVQRYLQATGRQASVEPGPQAGLPRIRFAVGRPRVSIIIPTAYRRTSSGGETFLARCLKSILTKSTYTNYRIVLLDRDDVPPGLHHLPSRPEINRAPYVRPFNWAAAINQGAALADGEYLLLLDDDTEVITPDWIESLLEYAQQPEVGAVGARLHFPDGRLQHAGVTVLDGVPGHPFYRRHQEDTGYFYSSVVPRNWSAVTGACLMTRADVFRAAGGMDETFGMNFNDIDYCLRVARAGRRIVLTPFARLYHHETATKSEFLPAELEMFKKRWQKAWPVDPFYNRNLSRRFHDFRIET